METVVYMLREEDDGCYNGPFLGKPGLDFSALAVQFREAKYDEAEKAEKDHCWINDSDFISWLLDSGVLAPLDHIGASYSLSTHGEHRYVPKHWPICPSCESGRGDECPGPLIDSLNRWEWHRRCIECGHIWDRHDEPHDSAKPMLDDDGRAIAGGCVPYSISQASGLPMPQVLDVCRSHGWNEKTGMYVEHAIVAAHQLGFQLEPVRQKVAGKLTLRRTLDQLSPSKKYIVGTRNHWLAVVHGENRDQSDTSMRAEVVSYWEVLPVSE